MPEGRILSEDITYSKISLLPLDLQGCSLPIPYYVLPDHSLHKIPPTGKKSLKEK